VGPEGSVLPSPCPLEAWRWVVAGTTAGAVVGVAALAPAAGDPAGGLLACLLFVGSACHVAATGWLVSLQEVRLLVRERPGHLVVAPVALCAVAVLVVALAPPDELSWVLVPLFAWQLHHFGRQNLGMVALAASSSGVARLTRAERRSIRLVGVCAVAAVVAHPSLLQLGVRSPLGSVFAVARVGFVVAALAGLALLRWRPRAERPPDFCAVFVAVVLFPLPLFMFSSPYAALAGMTVAHGFQYLVLVGLVAAGPRRSGRGARLASLAAVALVGGTLLAAASHLHASTSAVRLLFGVYAGVTAAHFVVDGGIWRLSDPLARGFLRSRAPSLLGSGGLGRLPIDRLPI
jgi:hypothetical protein